MRVLGYDFDEDCSHLLGLGKSADEIHVAQCKACGKMTTVGDGMAGVLGKACGNCGNPVDQEQVMTLADYLQQQMGTILWGGGEA